MSTRPQKQHHEEAAGQLALPLWGVTELEAELRAQTGIRVGITVTDNKTRMVSVKRFPRQNSIRLRIHRMFLSAPPEVVDALGAWVQHPHSNGSQAGAVIDAFIKANRHCIRRRKKHTVQADGRGECYDLHALFDEVNAAEFEGAVDATIGWGRMAPNRRRRSIRFGSYFPEEHHIRIHPLLDQPDVPRFFVRYIVFHEMLHAYLGIEESEGGRRRIHSLAFRQREQRYPDYERAEAWIRDRRNLSALLE